MLRTLIICGCALALLGDAEVAYATPPYALNLPLEYGEFGSRPPPDICERGVSAPCVLSGKVILSPIANGSDMRSKLSESAWAALQRASSAGTELWLFNVCLGAENQTICFAPFGVAVVKQRRVTFYAFFKPKTYPD